VFGLVVYILLHLHVCLNPTGPIGRPTNGAAFRSNTEVAVLWEKKVGRGGGTEDAVISVSCGGSGGGSVPTASSGEREVATQRRHRYELLSASNDNIELRSEAGITRSV